MTVPLSIETKIVDIQSNTTTIPAYLACPKTGQGPWPIVVVLQEIFGVNSHIRDVTDRVAQEGYIAIAPHIYHRQIQGFEVGYSDADLALGRKYKAGTKADELLSDVQGAIVYGQSLFDNVPLAAGCIGFCFGGHVAYLAATLPMIKATASFYGAGINSFTPGGAPPTVTRTAEIKGMIHLFFGMEDSLIPTSEIDDIERALVQHAVKHRVFRYADVGHGFFCDGRESYDAASAQDAWEHVKSLFNVELKTP